MKVELEEAFGQADYLTVHMPLTEETKDMVDEEAFAKMKDGVRVFNCARGGIIKESALVDALKSGKVAAASLDVYEQEPPSADNPLFSLPNVLCSPHIGSGDHLSRLMMGVEAAECIASLRHGNWPNGAVVNAEIQDGWTW